MGLGVPKNKKFSVHMYREFLTIKIKQMVGLKA
jgi:hypothetical protein